MIHLFTKASK